MDQLPLLFLIVLIASSIQSGTGFGFSMLSTPFLLFLYDAHEAVLINISLSLFLSIVMTIKLRKSIDPKLLLLLLTGSSLGFLPGVLLYYYMDLLALKIFISILILLISIILLFPHKLSPSISKSISVGGLSSFLASSIGIPGPPLLVYFSATKMEKNVIRSTTLCFFIIVYSVSLIIQLLFKKVSGDAIIDVIYTVPIVFIGSLIGEFLFRKIEAKSFHKILYLILAFTGISLLLTSI